MMIKGNDQEELIPLIAENEVIVVTVGADSPEHYESAYLGTAQTMRYLALEMDLPRHLIYTSSTSVYGDHQGQWVDETSQLLAKGDTAKMLIDAEKTYASLNEVGWHVCILRLSEIYGPGRELSRRVKKLEGQVLAGTGEPYTNMIHVEDIASAMDYALKHHLEGIYNLSDDEHPTRKDFYLEICKKFNLPEVKWDPEHTALHSGNKRVSNHKIKAEGFAFLHPHRTID